MRVVKARASWVPSGGALASVGLALLLSACASSTGMAPVGSGPNSTAAKRMNKKDEPQMAARIRKSASQPLV